MTSLYFLIDSLVLISVKPLGGRIMMTIMTMIMTELRRPGVTVTAARATVITGAAMTGDTTNTAATGDTRSSPRSPGHTDTPRQISNARKPVRRST